MGSDSDTASNIAPTGKAGDTAEALESLHKKALETIEGWGLDEAERITLRGHVGAQALELTAGRYQGAGWESLTESVVRDESGRARVLTLCALPARGALRPILGVDLVALGGRLSVAALDLSPCDDAFWVQHGAPILTHARASGGEGLVARELPEFARHSFSALAVITSAREPEQVAGVAAATRALLAGVVGLVHLDPVGAGPRAEEAYGRNLAWRRAELQNRREQRALTKIFGEPAARHVLEMLFPLPAAE